MTKKSSKAKNRVDTTDEETVVEDQAANEAAGEPESQRETGSEEPGKLAFQLEEAEQKVADHWDQVLRTRADMENLRRRTQRDLENAHKYGTEKLVNALLPVKDSMELGLASASDDTSEKDLDKLREGMELTLNMLKGVFEKFEIVEINPQNEKFNPELHEAMSIQESGDVEANTVLAVMQKGYTLNERLIRPAMVMVSRAAEKS